MKIILIAVLVSTFFGCAPINTQVQRQTSSADPSRACFFGLGSKHDLHILIPRIGSIEKADRASIEMMASTATPTDAEKVALSAWGDRRQRCSDVGREFRSINAPPGWVDGYEVLQSSVLLSIASLYAAKINYGQFIAERQRATLTATSEMNLADRRDIASRKAAAQADSERARVAMQNIINQQHQHQQEFQQQLDRQRASQPINTTCSRQLNTVNCITQ